MSYTISLQNKVIKTLELDKILSMLADCTSTEGGKNLALRLMPSDDISDVRKRLEETKAALYLLKQKNKPSFGAVKDVSASIEKAVKHASLMPRELLDIAQILRVSSSLLDYITNDPASETVIDVIFKRLIPNRFLENKIFRAIPVDDFIADEASPALADIRRQIRNAQSSLRRILSNYTSGSNARYLQENIVTVKNGRFVIPVKAEYKNEIKGLLHDTSQTGATVFIEPYAVVEANNLLRELEGREDAEIQRILAELSSECAQNADIISLDYLNITLLDFIFAKASFATKIMASAPDLNENKKFSLKNARHPLLDPASVVPISVSLGYGFDTLIITGPNTGGKTVAIKTIGLFALMAQCGLMLPCEHADICIFDEILADIGDEQSIEQSLSTFSSHMVNILEILNSVTGKSLVLFDELGSGTDPVEGAAIACSILEEIRSYNALCAATTHYSELKEYAAKTDRVVNAGCEFDIETLRPTYRLIVGTPGKSNAFAISEKIGFPKAVIDRAKSFLTPENRNLEDVIGSLDKERIALEKERTELKKEAEQFNALKESEEKRLRELREKTEKDAADMRSKAVSMIESARASSAFVFEKLDKLRRENEKNITRELLDKARNEIRQSQLSSENNLLPFVGNKDKDYSGITEDRPVRKGDRVIMLNIGKAGVAVTAPDREGKITVRVGMVNISTKIDNVKPVKAGSIAGTKNSGAVTKSLSPKDFRMEKDVRGLNGEEAWTVIDKYFDDAYLSGVYSVTVLHGKGTGALRKAVWEKLKKDPRVASFRAGAFGEGDYGVTVVELKH